LQIDEGLAFGLVLGFYNLPRFVFAARLQAVSLAGLGVHAVKNTAANTAPD
jgi:hypothetical protein